MTEKGAAGAEEEAERAGAGVLLIHPNGLPRAERLELLLRCVTDGGELGIWGRN